MYFLLYQIETTRRVQKGTSESKSTFLHFPPPQRQRHRNEPATQKS